MRLLLLAVIPVWGCGDYVTNSDFVEADISRQEEIAALEARLDSLSSANRTTLQRIVVVESQVDALEDVFVSDVMSVGAELHTEGNKK